MKLKIRESAPDFELNDESGISVSLSDYHGDWVLLYFYPKDEDLKQNKEIEGLSSSYSKLKSMGISVLGISTDNSENRLQFKEKYKIPFPLLSDEDREVSELYSVLHEGRDIAQSMSFLINTNGILVKIYSYVDPDTHSEDVMQDLEELQKK